MRLFKNTVKAQPRKLQHGFQPIYYFSRSIGLYPFTLVYNSNGSIKGARVHLFDSFWFLISIGLFLIALFFTYERVMHIHALNLNLSDMMYFLSQIPPLLFGSVGIVLNTLNRNKLTNILEKFIIFDNEVSLLFKSFHTIA